MSAAAILDTLNGLGVRATVTPGGAIRLEPASRVPAELLAEVRAHKPALLAHLTRPTLPVLPEPLARLIGAAVGGHLSHLATLPSGLVMDLGDYVLASASLYAAGIESERQEAALWEARRAWAS